MHSFTQSKEQVTHQPATVLLQSSGEEGRWCIHSVCGDVWVWVCVGGGGGIESHRVDLQVLPWSWIIMNRRACRTAGTSTPLCAVTLIEPSVRTLHAATGIVYTHVELKVAGVRYDAGL